MPEQEETPRFKVILTGDPYSSLQLIKSFKKSKRKECIKLEEKTILEVYVDKKSIYFWYLPCWSKKTMKRDYEGGDACIMVLYDGEYEKLPYFEKVYNEFKEVNNNNLVMILHDEPGMNGAGEGLAKKFGAKYKPVCLETNNYELILKEIAQLV